MTPKWDDWFWWLYDFMPLAVDNARKRASTVISLLRNLRVPLVLYRGLSHAGTQSAAIVAGDLRWGGALARRFFSAEPTSQLLKRVPFYRLPKVLREWSQRVDLVIAPVDRVTARLFDSNYLTVPGSISLLVPVPESVAKLNHLNSDVREDVRRVRAGSFGFEMSYSDELFEDFFDRYHMPLMQNRHGDTAVIHNRYLLRRMIRNGGILWITCDGHRVAGCVFGRERQLFDLIANGVEEGRIEILRQGALVATYYYSMCYAMQHGYTHIEFGSTAPFLNDSLFQYKRKWGPKIGIRENPYVALIHWPHFNDAVAKFLANWSLIFRDGDQLSAVATLCHSGTGTFEQAVKLFSQQGVAGLRRFWVISQSGWESTESSRMLGQTVLKMVTTFHPQDTVQSLNQ